MSFRVFRLILEYSTSQPQLQSLLKSVFEFMFLQVTETQAQPGNNSIPVAIMNAVCR